MQWTYHGGLILALWVAASGCSAPRRNDPQRNFMRWIQTLRDGSDERRARAAGWLGRLDVADSRPAIGPLIVALDRDPHPAVRANAAASLARIGGRRAFDPLIAALRDADARVRAAAAAALAHVRGERGQCRDRRVLRPLIAATADPDASVREAALRSLQANWDLDRRLHAQVLDCGVAASKDAEVKVRAAAAALMGRTGYGTTVVRRPLLALLKDDAAPVRAAAATAFGPVGRGAQNTGPPLGLAPLLEALQDPEPRVRAAMAKSLGEIADRTTVPALARALAGDKAASVRAAAATALGHIDDPRTIAPLVDALVKERDEAPCQAAVSAAARKGPKMIDALVAALERTRPAHATGVVQALATMKSTGVLESLTALLKSGTPAVRAAAARALGYVRDGKAASALAPLLKDRSPEVREGAAKALGLIGLRDSVPALIAALQDEEAPVRAAAAEALGYIAPGRDTALLRPPPGDPRAVEPLIAALRDASATVRGAAADSLCTLPFHIGRSNRSLPALLRDARAEVREAAARVLGHLGRYAYEGAIRAALRDPDWRVRLAMVRGKNVRGCGWLVATMKDATEHPAVRVAAIEALTPRQRVPHVLKLCEHFETVWRDPGNPPRVRAPAWRALQRIRELAPLRAASAHTAGQRRRAARPGLQPISACAG